MRLFNFLGVVVLLLCAAPVSKAGVYQEMKGLRSEAMGGAHRGLGTSNDTLFLNPAGMAMLRRYSVDLLYGYTSIDNLNHISVTAVDSKSGPLAGAVGYTHDRGELNGLDAKFHRAYGAIAYPIFEGVGLGLTGRYVRGDIERVDGTTEHLSFLPAM
ncbi:MAG: hypothetical protein R3C68_11720 [Myxococcota bacterium]